MWISKRLAEAGKRKPAADVSRVRSPGETKPESERAGMVYCGPWGIVYAPPTYARAVTVDTPGGAACVGTVLESGEGLSAEPGELLLFSKGGARIHLKNNGQVEINGQIFPPREADEGGNG